MFALGTGAAVEKERKSLLLWNYILVKEREVNGITTDIYVYVSDEY